MVESVPGRVKILTPRHLCQNPKTRIQHMCSSIAQPTRVLLQFIEPNLDRRCGMLQSKTNARSTRTTDATDGAFDGAICTETPPRTELPKNRTEALLLYSPNASTLRSQSSSSIQLFCRWSTTFIVETTDNSIQSAILRSSQPRSAPGGIGSNETTTLVKGSRL